MRAYHLYQSRYTSSLKTDNSSGTDVLSKADVMDCLGKKAYGVFSEMLDINHVVSIGYNSVISTPIKGEGITLNWLGKRVGGNTLYIDMVKDGFEKELCNDIEGRILFFRDADMLSSIHGFYYRSEVNNGELSNADVGLNGIPASSGYNGKIATKVLRSLYRKAPDVENIRYCSIYDMRPLGSKGKCVFFMALRPANGGGLEFAMIAFCDENEMSWFEHDDAYVLAVRKEYEKSNYECSRWHGGGSVGKVKDGINLNDEKNSYIIQKFDGMPTKYCIRIVDNSYWVSLRVQGQTDFRIQKAVIYDICNKLGGKSSEDIVYFLSKYGSRDNEVDFCILEDEYKKDIQAQKAIDYLLGMQNSLFFIMVREEIRCGEKVRIYSLNMADTFLYPGRNTGFVL